MHLKVIFVSALLLITGCSASGSPQESETTHEELYRRPSFMKIGVWEPLGNSVEAVEARRIATDGSLNGAEAACRKKLNDETLTSRGFSRMADLRQTLGYRMGPQYDSSVARAYACAYLLKDKY